MKRNKVVVRLKELYNKIINNKFLTICVLFTIFTMLDSFSIVLGKWPPKVGIEPYVHLLGRFILHSILVSSIYIFEILRKKIKSKLLIYAITYIITWGLLLIYVWSNSFFTELHPNAYIDVSRSYAFMYILLGIIFFIGNKAKEKMGNSGNIE